MSSPKIVVFTVYNATTGAPLTGAAGSFSFASYKDETGSTVSPPTISEIGGGNYKFTPVFTDPSHGISYVISTGANPAYYAGYLRPEDYNIDLISNLATTTAINSVITALASVQADTTLISKLTKNKWAIITSGADVNKMVFYDDDGVTPILKVVLADIDGHPTTTNPYSRTPE